MQTTRLSTRSKKPSPSHGRSPRFCVVTTHFLRFVEAIRDAEIDLIVVLGHVDIRAPEYDVVFSTIRTVRPDVPIQFFGGHTHVRDFKIFDERSTALESGRYLETLGFVSVDGLGPTPARPLSFSRLYIDNNLYSLHHHSGTDSETFPRGAGLNVLHLIQDARSTLGLDHRFGCAPLDLWINRVPYPHPQSICSWLERQVLPDQAQHTSRVRNGARALIITNTGALRFDVFKGPFTKDTAYLVSPFTSGMKFFRDVPFATARQVIKLLNNEGPVLTALEEQNALLAPSQLGAGRLRHKRAGGHQRSGWRNNRSPSQIPLIANQSMVPGYTTEDDAGDDGDDTLHSPTPFYRVPNCIQAVVGLETVTDVDDTRQPAFDEREPDVVDLVYNEFIQPWILLALQLLGERYNASDAESYLDGKSLTSIITNWVQDNWSEGGEPCL